MTVTSKFFVHALPSENVQKNHLVGIDLLRFFAAFSVMAFHMAFWSWAPNISTPRSISGGVFRYPEVSALSASGWVGVEIFFVISGFVIVYSANGTAWQFLRSRILRLVPSVWICAPITTALLSLLTQYSDSDILRRLIRSLTFWPFPQWVDGVYWTLGIEIAFYSVIFILLVTRLKSFIVPFLVTLGGASTVFWLVQITSPFPLSRELELTLLPHGCFFAIGGLLWAILINRASNWLWIFVALSVLGGVIEIAHIAIPRAQLAGTSSTVYLAIGIWIAGIVSIYLSIRYAGRMASLFPSGFARILGLTTYPLYLIYQTMGAGILKSSAVLGLNRWSALCLAMLLPILVSLVIVKYIERPIQNACSTAIDSKFSAWLRRIVDFRWPEKT